MDSAASLAIKLLFRDNFNGGTVLLYPTSIMSSSHSGDPSLLTTSIDSMDADASQRGRKNKFTGLKLTFLTALGPEFIVYRAEGRSGAFYDYAARRFLRKYTLKAKGDFYSEAVEDPDEPDDDDDGCPTQAEADAQKLRYDALRAVSVRQT